MTIEAATAAPASPVGLSDRFNRHAKSAGSAMEYRRLGKSGLRVSEFSFGAWVTFGKQVGEDDAASMMGYAYDNGVNFFDNAEGYESGNAELVMGEALKQLKWSRDTYMVSSKVFWGGSKPTQRGLSAKHVTDGAHQALKRLGVDYLDLYFCHRPDLDTPIEETVRAMHADDGAAGIQHVPA
jgi:aryl-alcohol dehydrogenase-like predicted oxidoreductase